MSAPVADVAVIRGTGCYAFLDAPEEHVVERPWGTTWIELRWLTSEGK